MTTNTAQILPPARQDPRQVVNTLKKRFQFNTANIATGVAFDNSLPQGAVILAVIVEIITAFNAAGLNTLTVGTNSTTYNNMVAAGDVNAGSVAANQVIRGIGGSILRSAELTPYVTYAQTGTAATTGDAEVTIIYEGGFSS